MNKFEYKMLQTIVAILLLIAVAACNVFKPPVNEQPEEGRLEISMDFDPKLEERYDQLKVVAGATTAIVDTDSTAKVNIDDSIRIISALNQNDDLIATAFRSSDAITFSPESTALAFVVNSIPFLSYIPDDAQFDGLMEELKSIASVEELIDYIDALFSNNQPIDSAEPEFASKLGAAVDDVYSILQDGADSTLVSDSSGNYDVNATHKTSSSSSVLNTNQNVERRLPLHVSRIDQVGFLSSAYEPKIEPAEGLVYSLTLDLKNYYGDKYSAVLAGPRDRFGAKVFDLEIDVYNSNILWQELRVSNRTDFLGDPVIVAPQTMTGFMDTFVTIDGVRTFLDDVVHLRFEDARWDGKLTSVHLPSSIKYEYINVYKYTYNTLVASLTDLFLSPTTLIDDDLFQNFIHSTASDLSKVNQLLQYLNVGDWKSLGLTLADYFMDWIESKIYDELIDIALGKVAEELNPYRKALKTAEVFVQNPSTALITTLMSASSHLGETYFYYKVSDLPCCDATVGISDSGWEIAQGGEKSINLALMPVYSDLPSTNIEIWVIDRETGSRLDDIHVEPNVISPRDFNNFSAKLIVDQTVEPGSYQLAFAGTSQTNDNYVVYGKYFDLEVVPGTTEEPPDLSEWKWVAGGYFNNITYGDGLYVAVGNVGAILTSWNGEEWTLQDSGTNSALLGITYGNDTFIAVGEHGTILTSPDGENWTAQTSGTSYSLKGITYGNGTFVAVGSSGTILTSPDG
ncbi:MAG: hypothetical protein GXO35_04380, partial [Gammaproteobacteria bacterium]|nr:hypothetical protein [Gammaproteobacteria bacterium]